MSIHGTLDVLLHFHSFRSVSAASGGRRGMAQGVEEGGFESCANAMGGQFGVLEPRRTSFWFDYDCVFPRAQEYRPVLARVRA